MQFMLSVVVVILFFKKKKFPVLQAALSALKQFSEQGLDPVDGTTMVENGSLEK